MKWTVWNWESLTVIIVGIFTFNNDRIGNILCYLKGCIQDFQQWISSIVGNILAHKMLTQPRVMLLQEVGIQTKQNTSQRKGANIGKREMRKGENQSWLFWIFIICLSYDIFDFRSSDFFIEFFTANIRSQWYLGISLVLDTQWFSQEIWWEIKRIVNIRKCHPCIYSVNIINTEFLWGKFSSREHRNWIMWTNSSTSYIFHFTNEEYNRDNKNDYQTCNNHEYWNTHFFKILLFFLSFHNKILYHA